MKCSRQNLGFPLDHSVDPLTVVASGAAVFSGTQQRLNARVARPAAIGEYQADCESPLQTRPLGGRPPMVGGKIVRSPARAEDFTGFTGIGEFKDPMAERKSVPKAR